MTLHISRPDSCKLAITAPDEGAAEYIYTVITRVNDLLEIGDPLPVALAYAAAGTAYLDAVADDTQDDAHAATSLLLWGFDDPLPGDRENPKDEVDAPVSAEEPNHANK